MLFLGRVALWSSLTADPGIASVVSLAFFAAAIPAGALAQSFIRKGTFYFLQRNFVLMRWVLLTGAAYGGATAALLIRLRDQREHPPQSLDRRQAARPPDRPPNGHASAI